jgi:hypothetical protein
MRPSSRQLLKNSSRKGYFDSNHRTDLEDYAAWEIHPVMKLDVKSD